MKRGFFLLSLLVLFLFPIVTAITGEVSESPLNVSVFIDTLPGIGDSGGSSGGGGGGGSSSSPIRVTPKTIEVTLFQGESYEEGIEITNERNSNLELQIIIKDINEFLSLNKDSLILSPRQTETVLTTFSTSAYTLPDVYLGRLLIQYGSLQEIVNTIVNVKQKDALFDLSVGLEKNNFLPGEQIPLAVSIFNLNSENPVQATLLFSITSLDNAVIHQFPSEELIVSEDQTVHKTLFIPEGFEKGEYILLGEIKYQDTSAFSYELFSVQGKSLSFVRFIDRINKGEYNIFLLMIFLIVAIIIFFLIEKVHREKTN